MVIVEFTHHEIVGRWKYLVSISCQYKLEVENQDIQNMVFSVLVQNSNSSSENLKKLDQFGTRLKNYLLWSQYQHQRMTRRLPSLPKCNCSINTNEYESNVESYVATTGSSSKNDAHLQGLLSISHLCLSPFWISSTLPIPPFVLIHFCSDKWHTPLKSIPSTSPPPRCRHFSVSLADLNIQV